MLLKASSHRAVVTGSVRSAGSLLVLSTQLLRVRPEDAGLRSAIERHETAQIQQAVYTQNVRRMQEIALDT